MTWVLGEVSEDQGEEGPNGEPKESDAPKTIEL